MGCFEGAGTGGGTSFSVSTFVLVVFVVEGPSVFLVEGSSAVRDLEVLVSGRAKE